MTSPKRQAVGAAESGSQCGAAGTGDDVDDDGDGRKDDGCPSTKYAYDELDRLQSGTDALARVTSYQYDLASNLTQRTDARGLVTKYFPDDLNRLDLIEHWDGMTLVDSVDYTYNAVGFRTQMVDPTGTTTYTPDALDRIASVTFPGPKTVSYTYDDAPGGGAADYPGQRTKITYPDGKYVDYTYLADGRMSTVTDWLAKQTAYTYDDAGRLTKTQYPNTVWTDYGYDAADRLTSVVNQKTGPVTISSFAYTLDSVGNRTGMTGLSGSQSYNYDALYRITNPNYTGQSDAYIYDANGNRTLYNEVQYSYDAADQLTCARFWWEQWCPSGGTAYGYDANGNQTSRGTDTFGYDHENRLTQSVIGGVSGTYTYNGDGLRASRNIGGTNVSYTWDVTAGLPVILQDSQGNSYVYGLDLISRTDSGGNQEYYLYDGLGSTTDLVDGSGTVDATYSYDVFGAIRSQTGSSPNYWLFTGEQRDSDSDLYFMYSRYYDPSLGRFLTPDSYPASPILTQSHNPYPYVFNNPVNLIDPYGYWGGKFNPVKAVKKTVNAVGAGVKAVVDASESVIDCVTSYDCSQRWAYKADWWAAQLQNAAAVTTNIFTVVGCAGGAAVSGGVMTGPGCLLGKGLGEWFTAPLQLYSNGLSIIGSVVDCAGRLLDEKEGGGFTWKNGGQCASSAVVTAVGFFPEANINAAAADFQLYCRDEGKCW